MPCMSISASRARTAQAILKKAKDCGAKSARIVDAQEELCRDFAFPVLQWQAKYEGIYLLGTSIARPLITKVCLQVAREVGADAYAHGATGKGNDQCRFQLAAEALEPGDQDHRPLADRKVPPAVSRPHRDDRLLRRRRTFPVKASVAKPYSSDENCLHISYEAGKLEDLNVNGVETGRVRHDRLAAEGARQGRAGDDRASSRACRSRSTARSSARWQIVKTLNKIGGRNGVGRIDMVENRFVGMKSRGVYEAPGMTILYTAHRALEQLTLDRDLMHLRDQLAPEVAEMVYYGFWYAAKMDALMAFIREAQKPVTGEVTLNLYKGNIDRRRPHQPQQPVRRRHRHHGRRRLLQPDRRRRLPADSGPARPRAGPRDAAEVLITRRQTPAGSALRSPAAPWHPAPAG